VLDFLPHFLEQNSPDFSSGYVPLVRPHNDLGQENAKSSIEIFGHIDWNPESERFWRLFLRLCDGAQTYAGSSAEWKRMESQKAPDS